MKKFTLFTMTKIVLPLLLLFFSQLKIYAQGNPQVQKIESLFNTLATLYVDSVDQKALTEDGIRAMLKDLDPHSVYIPADELKQTNEPLIGKFEGIGVSFNILEDTIVVTQVIAGGPSEKLGIKAGDRIVFIESENVTNIKIKNSEVMKRLRGDKGTKVNVKIYRRGEKNLLDFEIVRDKIPLYSVDAWYMATPETGYIKISRFAESTAKEFKEKLAELQKQGMKNIIIDLAGNGGGYMFKAIDIADEFLTAGKKVVYTESKFHNKKEEYTSSPAGSCDKGKVAVLVDESSASASEILSGALQDWDRALIIGRRTFAKGLVQKNYPLSDGSAVRLTISRYYTPSGRCIQKPFVKGEKGDEDYDNDLSLREQRGELFSADSIKLDDSLKYETSGKRIVYGGGGIMPDIFVPLDTSMNSTYYFDIRRKGIPSDFALTYADNNRKKLLSTYPDVFAFKKGFEITPQLMNDFYAYAEKKEIKKDAEGIKRSEKAMKIQLKALIARDLYNSTAYFVIYNEMNNFYQKAIQCMSDDTFDKMKISY